MNAVYNPFEEYTSDTVDNPFEYKLKIRTFANKTVDLIFHRIKHRIPKFFKDHMTGTVTTYSKGTDSTDEEVLADKIRAATFRARQAVQFAIRSIGADHMVTLHTRDCIQSKMVFFYHFKEFIRLVRHYKLVNGKLVQNKQKKIVNGKYKTVVVRTDYPFCAVPELQKRGAYHIHMAVKGYQDIPFLRACWYVALGGTESDSGNQTLGQVDVTTHTKRWGTQTKKLDTQTLVNYLTKYISKSFEEEPLTGEHRYTKSRGDIPKVNVQKQYLIACYANGKTFVDAMMETIAIARFIGVKDMFIRNKDEDLFIIKGVLDD